MIEYILGPKIGWIIFDTYTKLSIAIYENLSYYIKGTILGASKVSHMGKKIPGQSICHVILDWSSAQKIGKKNSRTGPASYVFIYPTYL